MSGQNTISFLPNSILISLSRDLLQLLNELKYLLLFFEKPLAILSNPYGDFLNEEAISSFKKDRAPKTNIFDDKMLINTKIIATDEWDEVMGYCEPEYCELKLEVSKSVDFENSEDEELNELMRFAKLHYTPDFAKKRKEDLSEEEYFLLEVGWVMQLNDIRRLYENLKRCRKRNIPMMWGSEAELHTSRIYTEFLLNKNRQKNFLRNSYSKIRQIKGHSLLREVMNLKTINILTAPVNKIVEFRKKNADLLNNFLIQYRNFLVQVQIDPESADKIIETETQNLIEKINTINNEISLLRDNRNYRWLSVISKEAYESAKGPFSVATWGALSSPLFSILALGGKLVKSTGKLMGVKFETNIKERTLLLRNSSGYLWKASKEFKPSS